MTNKYIEIYFDKANGTQRMVLSKAEDVTATVERKLKNMNIPFSSSRYLGKYDPSENYKEKTFKFFKYSRKYTWLDTIDLTKG